MASPIAATAACTARIVRRSLPLCALIAAGCNQMNSQALNSEGVRLYQLGNYQQAADQFQRAIASDPKSATSYYNLAASLHKTGKLAGRQEDLAQAERLYNQCLEYDPNHAECYRGLAVLLSETGRQDAAFRLLEGWADEVRNWPTRELSWPGCSRSRTTLNKPRRGWSKRCRSTRTTAAPSRHWAGCGKSPATAPQCWPTISVR